jgi:hypothetical protein
MGTILSTFNKIITRLRLYPKISIILVVLLYLFLHLFRKKRTTIYHRFMTALSFIMYQHAIEYKKSFRPKSIILIRNAESEGVNDPTIYSRIADNKIKLHIKG